MYFFKNIVGSLLMVLVISTEVKGKCTRPTTTDNAGIHPDDILKESFEEKSIIRLKCLPGYTASARSRLTCENGQWIPSPAEFLCQKKLCGSLDEFPNGQYEYSHEGNAYGAVVTAVCKSGFYIVGSNQRLCQADGTWDGRQPVCEVVKCGPAPTVINGKLLSSPQDEYEVDHAVLYKCDADYTLFEGDNVHCTSNGSSIGFWSSQPRCTMVRCERLDILNARRVAGGSGPYGYKTTLEYVCNDGFKMTTDSGRMVCEERGWALIPECKEIECPKVNATNATITQGAVGPYKYQSVIEYKCPAGQNPVGSLRLICGSSGQWSSKPPVCLEVVKCPEPRATNATFTDAGGPYKSGDVITYKCPAKQELVGISQLKCGSDGQWSSNPPVCKVVMCPEPPATNATRTDTGGPYVPGDIITYKCPAKQKLVGNSQLKCGSDGQLSSNPPVCKEVPGPNIVIIIIGILAALVIIIIIYCIWRRKNKQKTYTGPQSPAENQELKRSDAENAL